MKKKLLSLLVLLAAATTGAWAADPDQSLYQAALDAIEDDADYRIQTNVNGTTYYVTSSGLLSSVKTEAGVFHINKTTGGYFGTGFRISYNSRPFSNPPSLWTATNKVVLEYPSYNLHPTSDRDDWERQILYLNSDGKYAIRSSNTEYGETSWNDAGRTFWTHTDSEPITPCYTYDPTFIWEFVKYVPVYNLTVDAENNLHGTIKFFANGKEVAIADEDDLVTMSVSPDEGYGIDSVAVEAYTTWASARRRGQEQPTNIPLLGSIALTPVQGVDTAWTFTMPAASVMASATYLKASTLYLNPADQLSKLDVTVDGTAVTPDQEGKLTKVNENANVKLNAKRGYVIEQMEVKKKSSQIDN